MAQPLALVHGRAQQHAHQRAGQTQQRHAPQQVERQRRGGHVKVRRSYAEDLRHGVGGQRRAEAGHQSGIVQLAHADDLQGEDSCGQRRAEQCGEQRAHAAERGEAPVLVVQPEQPGDVLTQAAAYLQRRALAPRAAAAQVRGCGGDEDGRHQQHAYAPPGLDGLYHRVGTQPVQTRVLVQQRYARADGGQQPQQPRVRGSQLRRRSDAGVKRRAYQAAHQTRDQRHGHPFAEGARKLKRRFHHGIRFFHVLTPVGRIYAQTYRFYHKGAHFSSSERRFVPLTARTRESSPLRPLPG